MAAVRGGVLPARVPARDASPDLPGEGLLHGRLRGHREEPLREQRDARLGLPRVPEDNAYGRTSLRNMRRAVCRYNVDLSKNRSDYLNF